MARRAIDVTTFALALVVGTVLFLLQAAAEKTPDGLLIADLVAGGLLCLALWGRRRWPVPLAILAALLTAFSAASGAAAAVLLFTVSAHRRASLALGIAALHLAAGVAFVGIRPNPEVASWVQAVITLPIVAAVVAWGMYVRARRQLLVSLRERARRVESEQQLRIVQARYLERARIAREMHDVLAHRISLVSLHAGALEFRVDAAPEEVARSAAVIRASAHQALQDLREILGVLRSDGDPEASADPLPALADVVRLVEESQQAGLPVRLDCTVGELADVPVNIGRTAYRVVQEGLTNARKHAPGTAATVLVSGQPGRGLEIEVRNRGPIQTPAGTAIPGAGQGLIGLRERTVIAGGRLEHGRTPNGDFRLAAWLPWPR